LAKHFFEQNSCPMLLAKNEKSGREIKMIPRKYQEISGAV
jgi:hypothetical protein